MGGCCVPTNLARVAALPCFFLLAACETDPGAGETGEPFEPVYGPIETQLLEGDLVGFQYSMTGARTGEDLRAYADCAAAQYALIRGYGFARHVRTNVDQRGAVWTGDSIYTISPTLPRGLQTVEAATTVQACRQTGIPTV